MRSVPGYTIAMDTITSTYQMATFRSTDVNGQIYVFYRGAFDPGVATARTEVVVDGHTGYVAAVPSPDPAATPNTRTYALVWPYAENGWAVVIGSWGVDVARTEQPDPDQPTGDAAATQANAPAFARALYPSTTATAVPVRITPTDGLTVSKYSVDGPNGGLTLHTATGTWAIGWSLDATIDSNTKPHSSVVLVNGRQWIVTHSGDGLVTGLAVGETNFGLTLTWLPTSDAAKTLPLDPAALQAFAARITLAPKLGEPTTWFAGTTVIG
jgi:hypothetical protein